MNYIDIFKNAKAFSVSFGNSYTEDHLMHILLDNFHQGGKYTSLISSNQAYLRREEIFTEKTKSIYFISTD